MNKYVIDIGGRNEASAGIRALHILRDELRARGYEAQMSYEAGLITLDTVAVYPEIQGGNPLGVDKIARWLLGAAPDLPDGAQFQWGGGMDPKGSPILCVDLLEDYWTPELSKGRGGVGYWVGRGASNFDRYNAMLEDYDNLMRLPDARNGHGSRRELAEWMAGLDYLYSFDPYTAIITEAINVGTPVVVLCDPDDPRLQCGMSNEWNRYGVAWTWDSLEEARATVGLASYHYRNVCCPEFDRQIDRFVSITQAL